MNQISKRSLLKTAAWTSLAAAAMLVGCGKKEEPAPVAAAPHARTDGGFGTGRGPQGRAVEDRLRLCRPGRRRRLDLCARQRPQGGREGIRRQGADQLRREGARGGRRRARLPRHDQPGQQADLRHHLRLHGADAEGRGRCAEGRQVRTCHRLQAGREHAHLRQPHLRRCLHGRRDCRRHDQDQLRSAWSDRSRFPR